MPDLCSILAYDNSMLGIQSYHLNICVCVFTLYRVTQKGGTSETIVRNYIMFPYIDDSLRLQTVSFFK